ncbi:MAG TPA: hypothetical protein VNA17_05130 [Pyrinomonadaceae bacterium]|nr:hypothetical protein [Pyrinomonadaceae bacterium]
MRFLPHRILARPVVLLAALIFLVAAADAQKARKGQPGVEPAILWERVNIRQQNLFYGPGGQQGMPDLSRVTFIKEEKGGHSKKYRVKDGSGRVWVAKVGDEAQSETAAVRLISALGYKSEINYLVPRLTIDGKGTFSNVRLEARPEDVDRGKEWRWGKTPFEGTPQMKGLILMMAFINNWDMKSANNVILKKNGEKHYAISDLGVSFGKTGSNSLPIFWRIGRSRNKPTDYAKAPFIKESKNNRVKVVFNGKNRSRMNSFTTADAGWLAGLLRQLTDSQIRDAFRAANYSASEINLLTQAVRSRITQLDRAAYNGRIAGNQ